MRRGIIPFSILVGVLGLALILLVAVYTIARSTGGGVPVSPERHVEGGNPGMGPLLITKYGCGGCHTIEGVRSATGEVGPPLNDIGERAYIAGNLPNTPENLIAWIQVPQEIEPGTAMPNLGVTDSDARDLAAYLYSLE